MRCKHGLLNIGGKVKGLNGTRCFERPEKVVDVELSDNTRNVADIQMAGINRRLSRYDDQAERAVNRGNAKRFILYTVLIEVAHSARAKILPQSSYIKESKSRSSPGSTRRGRA